MADASIEKPNGPGRREPIKLDATAAHLLEECRMVLPGIQALFGFQLIAVFNSGFDDKLSRPEQQVHFAALFLVALAAALVMAPAAIHRQTQQRFISERFIWTSSKLVLLSMFPLAGGLTLDIYLIARVVFESATLAGAFAILILLAYAFLWIFLPRYEKRRHI